MRQQKLLLGALLILLLLVSLVVPAGASISPDQLRVVLAQNESITESKEVFVPPKPPQADIVFSFDLTGSMGSIINTAKARAADIINGLNAIPDVDIQYGIVSYMDYPHSYSFCGYSNTYGAGGDYAYSLDQAVTGDASAVTAAINNLTLGNGMDGPQDYTRIFYESYADPNISWRAGAKRILVNFGDNVPHDCNLNEGVTGGIWTTGCDPGRDEIAGTGDDLDLQAVLAEMATNGVVLLESHTTTSYNAYWTYWTGLTGGHVFITNSGSLVDDIITEVQNVLEAPMVYGLHLEASPLYESWLESVSPASYDEIDPGPDGTTVPFDLTIRVPEGTPAGFYEFTISALDEFGVNYGDQAVTIIVYDPGAGFVTGGGWFISPEGAYSLDPTDTGKVTWGFVSKYHRNASVPSGETEFQLHSAGLNFHSTGYEYLVVLSDAYAIFRGSGTINGEGDYQFVIWAGDAEPDTFRIKIWEPGNWMTPIYDNGYDQPIDSGSIIIHTKGW